MARIIAIAGEIGSGKDTAAKPLLDRGFEKLYFARTLKELSQYLFDLSDYDVHDQEGKEQEFETHLDISDRADSLSVSIAVWLYNNRDFLISVESQEKMLKSFSRAPVFSRPREILQYLGTEVLRECIHEDFHAMMEEKYMEKFSPRQRFVITDCRFTNERDWVRKMLGVTVRIIRPIEENKINKGLTQHKSENSLGDNSEYDFVIYNDKDLNHVETEVLKIYKQVS